MMAGPGAARLMDTLLGILRRAALIDESRRDRGYAAIDRTRALGARVGCRVGEPGDLGGAQIWAAARIIASSRGL